MKTSRRELFRFASTGAAMSALLVFFLFALSPALGQDVADARKQNQDHIKQCTERHAYNPEDTTSLGPYELGSGEREWRECVYEGVQVFTEDRVSEGISGTRGDQEATVNMRTQAERACGI